MSTDEIEKLVVPSNLEEQGRGGREEMEPRTDAIHVNGEIMKFRNHFCHVCGNKGIVRISESAKNPRKKCFCCDSNRCDYFEFWC